MDLWHINKKLSFMGAVMCIDFFSDYAWLLIMQCKCVMKMIMTAVNYFVIWANFN